MRIVIETVEHSAQRYDTCGDWRWLPRNTADPYDKGDVLAITVSRMADWRSEALVAVHELVEALLCRHAGITAEQVDAWDTNGLDEPGDDPRAPYHLQHVAATNVERQLAPLMDLLWPVHEENVASAATDDTIRELTARRNIVDVK
jgi:hypothetical protein